MSSPLEGPLEIPEGMFDQAQELAAAVPADVSFGVGFKATGSELTDTVALVVYVPEKKPESELSQEELIPREFAGHPTDVVEWNPIPIEDSKAYEKLHGGIEIVPAPIPIGDVAGTGGIWVERGGGTLGAIARRRSDGVQVLLTASHVVMEKGVLVGDIQQPRHGAVIANTGSGTVERHDKGLDCAAVEPNGKRKLLGTVEGVGPVMGARRLSVKSLGVDVKKRGRTTELTTGQITAIKQTAIDEATLEMTIAPPRSGMRFAWEGDSGSVVLNTRDEVVGLLHHKIIPKWDPTQSLGVATLIDFVQDALAVDVLAMRPALKKGSKGGAVRLLQDGLVSAGYLSGPADGDFGRGTLAAVKKFQAKHAPPADGGVGRITWAKLAELGHVPWP
ncbi:MAG TPA: peptidoglycan-binding protein [Thermoleophilaceae bacterium]|jgi:hypothetical protein